MDDSEVGMLVANHQIEMNGNPQLMKKILVCITCTICLLAVFAFAADKPATNANKGAVLKATNVKTAKMNARGKVVEISGKAIKIERSIKGNAEIMEFALENPVLNIAVNDSVKIDYSVKEGKLTAARVAKLGAVKNSNKNVTKQTGEKPASATK
jgi:hypothetical protein